MKIKIKNNSIRTKINIIFVLAIVTIILFAAIFSIWISKNYVNFKFQTAKKFYENNQPLSAEEFVDYLGRQGFVVTYTDEQGEHQDFLNNYLGDLPKPKEKLHINAQTLTFEANNRLYTVSINQNVVNDIVKIITLSTVFLIILFIISLLVTNVLLKKMFITKIEEIKSYLTKLEKNEDEFLEYQTKDEIGILLDKINKYNKSIQENNAEKKNLVNTFAHELKTPLARIEAINFLYQNKDKDYLDFANVQKDVQREIIEMKNLISESLYVFDNSDTRISEINVKNIIEKNLKDNESLILSKNLKINSNLKNKTFKGNEIYFELIIKNIISNMIRHGNPKKEFLILMENVENIKHEKNHQTKITFINTIIHKEKNDSKGYGKLLINKLAGQMNLKIKSKIEVQKYVVEIYF